MNTTDKQKSIFTETNTVRTGKDKSRLQALTNELKVLEALERQLLKLEGKK
jgi:hypothetical protein